MVEEKEIDNRIIYHHISASLENSTNASGKKRDKQSTNNSVVIVNDVNFPSINRVSSVAFLDTIE